MRSWKLAALVVPAGADGGLLLSGNAHDEARPRDEQLEQGWTRLQRSLVTRAAVSKFFKGEKAWEKLNKKDVRKKEEKQEEKKKRKKKKKQLAFSCDTDGTTTAPCPGAAWLPFLSLRLPTCQGCGSRL